MDEPTRYLLDSVTYEDMGCSPDMAEALRQSEKELSRALAAALSEIAFRILDNMIINGQAKA